MTDPYKVLGISPTATDTEVKNAYRALARKYHPDNYTADNPLAELATEKMKEINEAYDLIMRQRAAGGRAGSTAGTDGNVYLTVRDLINRRRFRDAETLLSRVAVEDRTADWHYLESLCLMSRGFVNDAMRELETACTMAPDNQEYQQAKQMFNQNAAGYGQNYRSARYRSTSSGSGCDMCLGLLCADSCCECMGGDCISCC